MAECCRTCRIEDLAEGDYDEATYARNQITSGVYRDLQDYMSDHDGTPKSIQEAVKSCLREKKLGNCSVIGVMNES
jgi:hypothetical protein